MIDDTLFLWRITPLNNEELRKVGLKATAPRIKILQFLAAAEHQHFSAEDVYKDLLEAGVKIGLATIYRVLTQFESAGLVDRHHFENGHSVFEIRQDKHHDHLVCIKCGAVEEFVDPIIEKRQSEIAAEYRFDMTDHSLNIYGVCARCR